MNIPEGYRILGPNEVIQEGDKFECYSYWETCHSTIGKTPSTASFCESTTIITPINKNKIMENETLTINKQRVLEAASKCEDVRQVMKTLWPEIFEPDIPIFKLGDILDNSGPKFMVVKHTNNTYKVVYLTPYEGNIYVHNEEYKSLEDMSHAWRHMKVIGNIKDLLSKDF